MKLFKLFVWPEMESYKCAKYLFSKEAASPPEHEVNSLTNYAERVKDAKKVKSQILYTIDTLNRVRYNLMTEALICFCLQTVLPLAIIIGFLFSSPRISLVLSLLVIGTRVYFYFFTYGDIHFVRHYAFEDTSDACQYTNASLQYYHAELKKYLSRE